MKNCNGISMQTNEITLISLAMLKVHIDNNQDYLEYLRPFINYVLFKCRPETITDQSITELLQQEFGLIIPPRSAQIVLKRISKSGIIVKHDGIYKVIRNIDDPGIDERKAEASRHISAVINDLTNYWKKETSIELLEDDAINSILEFLSEFSIPFLKNYLRGTAIPEIKDKKPQNIILVSKFLIELSKSQPERFESFMILMQGHMLANGILCPDLGSAPKSYHGVYFFLDTPIIIQRFNLEGEAKRKSTEELVFLLKQLNAKIAIFSHTFDEFISVIKGAAENIDSPQGKGAIVYEARRTGKTKSDFLLLLGQVEDKLKEYQIEIIQTPKYSSEYQISEVDFEHILDDEISYYNPQAKRNDINSVRSIYELRKGISPSTIEKSKAVFITNNTAFSKSAFEFGKKFQESQEISSVITDFSIANMAWLKAPMGSPSLPRKEVIAYSYAALCPSKEMLNKYLNQIEKLKEEQKITEKDHQLLRSSYLVNEELMTLTLGDESALTNESIFEINRRITEEIKKEEKEMLYNEQNKHLETKQELEEVSSQREILIKNIFWKCQNKAGVFKYIVMGIFIIIISLGIASGFGIKSSNNVLGNIIVIFLVCFSVLTFFNLYKGTTAKSIIDKLQEKYFNHCIAIEEKKIGFKIEVDECLK